MRGHVYVIHGDITKCKADAIAFSTSTRLQQGGKLYASFAAFEGFAAEYQALRSKTLTSACQRHFGSFTTACRAAGLSTEHGVAHSARFQGKRTRRLGRR